MTDELNLKDYVDAVGLDGPLSATWSVTPHRLVFDLVEEVKRLRAMAAFGFSGGGNGDGKTYNVVTWMGIPLQSLTDAQLAEATEQAAQCGARGALATERSRRAAIDHGWTWKGAPIRSLTNDELVRACGDAVDEDALRLLREEQQRRLHDLAS